MRRRNNVALVQGAFYVVSGLWPVLHLRSFEAVTGRKQDGWLAQTTGGLIAAVGAALAIGAVETPRSRALAVLGMGAAAVLGTADVVFTARRRIRKVYLLDALAEGAVIAAWLYRVANTAPTSTVRGAPTVSMPARPTR